MFFGIVGPKFLPNTRVHEFGTRFREPVGQSLQQDGTVIVVLRFKSLHMRVDTDTGCHGKPTDVILNACVEWCQVVGKAMVTLSCRLTSLLS